MTHDFSRTISLPDGDQADRPEIAQRLRGLYSSPEAALNSPMVETGRLLAGLAVCIALQAPAEAFNIVPVVPADSNVMEAPPEVVPAQANFLGRWEGALIGHKGQIPHTLVVERMRAKTATVLWSTGDSTATNAEVRRVDAQMKSPEEMLVPTIGRPMVYRMNSDGTLSSVFTYYGLELRGTMKKVAGPTVPYAAEFKREMNWPPGVRRMLHVPKTNSPIRAEFPEELKFAAIADVPPERALWIGKWSGATCRDAACDAKLAVLDVDGDTATVVALWANSRGIRLQGIRLAAFVGDELRVVAPGNQQITYRMRDDNTLELYRISADGSFSWGVLARE